MAKKINVYLDMDGTLYDLYGRTDWLARLRAEDKTVFEGDYRMTDEETVLKMFPADTYMLAVLSMTPKGATKDYCDKVIEAKNEWLDKYFPSITKRIYLKYGANKNLKNSKNAILVDDSEPIRNSWRGTAINPTELWG